MIGRPGPARWVAILLVSVYGVRAVSGFMGAAYTEGRRLAASAHFERALPLLERSAVGQDRAAALWLTAQVRLGIWHVRLAAGESPESMGELMRQAFREYSEAISLSPASGWYWAGLADIYHQQERIERYRAGFSLDLLGQDPWSFVGRSGRTAIGMLRIATRKEPSVYYLQDQLAFVLLDYKLRPEALETVRRSAAVQPIYRLHEYKDLDVVPPEFLDAFAESSREALGHTPFLKRVSHLLALGRIEIMRGEFARAERDLRDSLEVPGTAINRAEAHYYLGRALDGQGQTGPALEALRVAGAHPTFAADALAAQAEIAERQGRLDRAMELMLQARLAKPHHLGHALGFARLARKLNQWSRAESALQLAALVHPDDPRPLKALGFTYIEQGDEQRAREVLRELERMEQGAREAQQLRQALDGSVAPRLAPDRF